uniref:Uncharacterized protein n=1 Tax=Aegilops tauschii subsp. strangulata TaxID=200361 RepID=A0A453KSZ8_AEGTS
AALRLHGLQVLLHDPEDEHRLQRVLPEDQEGAAPDARAGEPPDRPEARPGERLGRLQPAGRGHQDQEADQPARRDTGAQGGRRARGRRRAGRRRWADAPKLKPTLCAPAEHSDAAPASFSNLKLFRGFTPSCVRELINHHFGLYSS